MTLAQTTFPGYDADFYGAGGLGETAAGKIGSAISSAQTTVSYAYKCGQGTSMYRCYGVGKYSHAVLVDLQHQLNRVRGTTALAEDGILGPSTLAAAQAVLAPMGPATLAFARSLDTLAASAPQLVEVLRRAADAKRGAEPAATVASALLSAMSTAADATAAEIQHDKQTGAVPAAFTQDSVRTDPAVFARIGQTLGPAIAEAAAKADQIAQGAGSFNKRSTMTYVAVGAAITVGVGLVITVIALAGRKGGGRRAARA